jgi:broad specificity phosphatase PhoE
MPKVVEVRRHAMRLKDGQHLSQEGVTLARRVGKDGGPFDRVITSTLPRAFETAIAMGFAVDEQSELISTYGGEVEREIPWPQTFAAYAGAVRRGGAAAEYAGRLAMFYRRMAEDLPEDGRALVINHGGIVELGAVACVPGADYESFGPHCAYCEGVRLFWDRSGFVRAEALRIQWMWLSRFTRTLKDHLQP